MSVAPLPTVPPPTVPSPSGLIASSSAASRPRRSRSAWRRSLSPAEHAQLDALARNLKAARARRRYSQRGLATMCGVNASHIAMLERGLENATVLTLLRLARALRTSPAALLAVHRPRG